MLVPAGMSTAAMRGDFKRSEEHTSELQSQSNLVCRLLLEKKKLHPAGNGLLLPELEHLVTLMHPSLPAIHEWGHDRVSLAGADCPSRAQRIIPTLVVDCA